MNNRLHQIWFKRKNLKGVKGIINIKVLVDDDDLYKGNIKLLAKLCKKIKILEIDCGRGLC